MAKTGFFQSSTIVVETVGDLTETTTDNSATDDKAKTSFYQGQTFYEQAAAAADILDDIEEIQDALESTSLVVRIPVFMAGSTGPSELILRFIFTDTVLFPADLSLSEGESLSAATAESVFSIQKNDVEFATATFAAASTQATFAGTETTFEASDVLSIVAPVSTDTTLANISLTLAANRVT